MKVDDGPWIIDAWKNQAATTYTAGVPLAAGEHTVTVEYFENTGGAVASVSWAAQACAPGEWSGSYFANVTVSGEPGLVRCEGPDLDFAWGTGGPGGGIPAMGSRRGGPRRGCFEAGVFEFTATADDGVRVKVDDGPWIIDGWKNQAADHVHGGGAVGGR